MTLTLHTLQPKKGARRTSKRVGRGNASGKGTYSARGMKGQRARSGGRRGLKEMSFRRILLSVPKKRGFRSLQQSARALKIGDIENKLTDGMTLTRDTLVKFGFVHRTESRVKLLGVGTVNKKIIVKGLLVSKKAREMIEAAGGSIEA